MFYKCRKESPGDWCVLGLHSSLLLTAECKFYPKNAALSEYRALPEDQFRGARGLGAMFQEEEGKPTRCSLGIPEYFTTNPQAEVIHVGTVSRENIIAVAFESEVKRRQYEASCHGIPTVAKKHYFDARLDYKHWRTSNGE